MAIKRLDMGYGFSFNSNLITDAYPGRQVIMDTSIGIRDDLFARKYEPNLFTIRYNRHGSIRIPGINRITMYRNKNKSPEDQVGSMLINNIVVCCLDEVAPVMTSPEVGGRKCNESQITEEFARLKDIYGSIPEKNPISIYFIDRIFDERYFFQPKEYLAELAELGKRVASESVKSAV